MTLIFPFIFGIILGVLVGYFIGYSTAYKEVVDNCFAGKSNNETVQLTSGDREAIVEVKHIGVKK